MTNRPLNTDILQTALGFVAGYVNTISYISLGGIFVTMVTGNIVLLGTHLSHLGDPRVFANLITIPVFVTCLAIHSILHESALIRRLSQMERIRSLLLLQTVLLAVFEVFGERLSRDQFPLHNPRSIGILAAIGVCAMTPQNAFARLIGSAASPTTIMTGNAVQATMSLTTLIFEKSQANHVEPQIRWTSVKGQVVPLLGFFVGALTAASCVQRLHFRSLWIACYVLIFIMVLSLCCSSSEPAL